MGGNGIFNTSGFMMAWFIAGSNIHVPSKTAVCP
jgi:hypothetical protein